MEKQNGVISHIVGFGNLLKEFLVPTAIISAITYYVGWSANAGYYLRLGLSPSFIQKSVPEVLVSAWLEMILAFGGAIIGLAVYYYIQTWLGTHSPFKMNSQIKVSNLFLISLLCAVPLGLIAFYLLQNFSELPFTFRFSVWTAIFLLAVSLSLFVIASATGMWLQANQEGTEVLAFRRRILRVLFPDYRVYIAILIVALVFIASRAGIWRGSISAIADIEMGDLPRVTLHSPKPLPLQGHIDQTTSLYVYSDLLLIDVNDKYIFVMKGNATTKDFTTYAIPRSEEVILELLPF